jgi:hypothetical protein
MEHVAAALQGRMEYAAAGLQARMGDIRLRPTVLIVTLVLGLTTVVLGQSGANFVPLFNGTLAGWTVENSEAGNFTVSDGVLRVAGPGGWLRSAREYNDFSLKTEFRFLTPDADSGLFIRARSTGGFGRGWPTSSYQVQMRNPLTPSRLPPVGGLFRHGMPPGETTFDAAAVEKLARATGDWQTIEVDVMGDRLVARFNGGEVLKAGGIANASGYIGLQGETGVVEFRSLDVRAR